MERLRFFLALLVLLVAFPLALLSFRHRERLEAVAREAETAEARGQFRFAAAVWERGAILQDRLAEPLLATLDLFGVSTPTRSGMLLRAVRAHERAAVDSLVQMRENPAPLVAARAALRRLAEEFGDSELSRETAARLLRLETLQRAQTDHLADRYDETIALLRRFAPPDGETGGQERFLRARLLALAHLARHRAGGESDDLARAAAFLETCFDLDPDDPVVVRKWRETERLLLERVAERIPWRGEGSDAPARRKRR